MFVGPLTPIWKADSNWGANMKIEDFEKELQLINSDLSIRPNNPPARVVQMYPDVIKLASITFRGVEVCTIPNYDIYDEPSGSYGVDLRQDGMFKRHRTRPEALAVVKDTLQRLQDNPDFAAAFFGTGEYSTAALNARTNVAPEVIQEVPIELKAVQGETLLESPKDV